MLHACVQRFDMTGNLEKFCKILETKQALCVAFSRLSVCSASPFSKGGCVIQASYIASACLKQSYYVLL